MGGGLEGGIGNAECGKEGSWEDGGKVGKKASVGDREKGLKAQSSKLKEGEIGS
jgi:hypothetical protein